jgi:hypothetical protein
VRLILVVAVGIAVIVAVIVVTAGVVADSSAPGTLAFFGVSVRTTSAQIFLTGAICTWALLAAIWLLSAGIRRSRRRGAQLAALKKHRRSAENAPDPAKPPVPARPAGFTATQSPAPTDGGAGRGVAYRTGTRDGGHGSGTQQDVAEQPPGG